MLERTAFVALVLAIAACAKKTVVEPQAEPPLSSWEKLMALEAAEKARMRAFEERRAAERQAAKDREDSAREQRMEAEARARAEENQRIRDQNEAYIRDLQTKAKERGYDTLWPANGLAGLLSIVVAEAVPVSKLRKIAVPLNGTDDADWRAIQIVSGQALMVNDYAPALILIKGITAYEGTALVSTGVEVVRVTGITSYQSNTGPRQAFVVEPAW